MLGEEKYAYGFSSAVSLLRARDWDVKVFRPAWLTVDFDSMMQLLPGDSLRVKAALREYWPESRDFGDRLPKAIRDFLMSRLSVGGMSLRQKQ